MSETLIIRLPGRHYGGAIRLARDARGFTQARCAKACGMSQSKLSKLESDDLALSAEDGARLSEVLGYPVSFFYDEEKGRPPTTPMHFCSSAY